MILTKQQINSLSRTMSASAHFVLLTEQNNGTVLAASLDENEDNLLTVRIQANGDINYES